MQFIHDAWQRTKVHHYPYTWLETAPGELLTLDDARRLAECFPTGSFVRKSADRGDSGKSYSNYSRPLTGPGAEENADLPAVWQECVAALLAPRYRTTVSELLNVTMARELEIRLVRHASGDWLGPHTDRADKLFSHVFYLNPGWQADWGGCLQILGSENPGDVVHTVVPELGASVLMARADNSWHQVGRVRPHADGPARERTSLLVHGLR